MTTELLTRIAAKAAQEAAKSARQRDQMRAKYPEASAFIGELKRRGMLHAVTVDGVRYGPPPLDDRRSGRVPPVPGRR